MKHTIFLVLFFINVSLFAQSKQGNIWYFGKNAGIDFNNSSPTPLTDGAMNTQEGCSAVADTNGSLLFYTDGVTVWNRDHSTMLNGTGLLGHRSSSQSAVVIPKPGSTTIYYIFTVDWTASAGSGLNYSEVDMSAAGTLGAITANKNIPLISPTDEKVTAVAHRNKIDMWVATQLSDTNLIYTYLVTSAGVTTPPIINPIGLNTGSDIGCMKFSSDGSRLAIAKTGNSTEVYDFNDSTGVLSNPLIFNISNNTIASYGVEFSPDNNLLYVSGNNNLSQYDLTNSNPLSTEVTLRPPGLPAPATPRSLQIGPNGKIYVARSNEPFLGVINNPNTPGVNCDYIEEGFNLGGPLSDAGLPVFIQSFFKPLPFTYTGNCFNSPTTFNVDLAVITPDSVKWNFGDPASGTADTSTSFNPMHMYSDTGSFTVSLTHYTGGVPCTSKETITILPIPSGMDTFNICKGDSLLIGGAFEDTTGIYMGTIVSGAANGCDSMYTVDLRVHDLTVVNFTVDTTSLCQFPDATFIFINTTDTTGGKVDTSVWNFGDGSPPLVGDTVVHTYDIPGIYDVSLAVTSKPSAGACTSDTTKIAYITVLPNPMADFMIDPNPATNENPLINFTNQSLPNNIETSLWAIDTLTTSSSQDTSYQFTQDGNYEIKLLVTDSNGCVDSTIQTLVVEGEYKVFIPNAFTPNGDGLNETWDISAVGIENEGYELTIFNRWGTQLLKFITATPWDGKYEDKLVQNGVYPFQLDFIDTKNKEEHTVKGFVIVAR